MNANIDLLKKRGVLADSRPEKVRRPRPFLEQTGFVPILQGFHDFADGLFFTLVGDQRRIRRVNHNAVFHANRRDQVLSRGADNAVGRTQGDGLADKGITVAIGT